MTIPDVQKTYREAAVRSASEVQLVIMMYDMIGQDLRRAIDAIHRNDVEARSSEIKHALAVLEQLQGTLNMQAGGSAARNLDRFYAIARGKLLEAHIKVSEALLTSQIEIFADLREAWQRADESAREKASPSEQQEPVPVLPVIAPPTTNAVAAVHCDWSA